MPVSRTVIVVDSVNVFTDYSIKIHIYHFENFRSVEAHTPYHVALSLSLSLAWLLYVL